MNTDPALVGLPAVVSAEDAATQFDSLQKKLVPLWRSIESFNQDEQTIVVVPSMSIDMDITGLEVQAYEERFLFLLLLLTQPRARMIYVTSQAIHPSVVEYYLDLLPGVIPSHALRRLTLLAPDIVERILDDRWASELDLDRVMRPFPFEWRSQQLFLSGDR